ncbi:MULTISPECIES: TIR domain-containing protein [unclassified Paraflavitalea]|uniref:TIR domain-containing protein n=1 Tax=unclassified Paraflavitalea TaxID=2798305 RepID=UPI003D33C29C
MTDSRLKRIFLSYSYHDKSQAEKIAKRLMNTGFEVVSDYSNLSSDRYMFDEIKYLFQSSDFVLILLSKSLFESSNFRLEYSRDFFYQTRQRKVTIIPVLIEKCDIPSDLIEFEIFSLTNDFEKGFDRLLKRIKAIPEISFDNFSATRFEELVFDLLKAYGFINIQREQTINDKGVDFIAEFLSRSPFGLKTKEVWMIETKFYSESRFDIKAIKQIVELYKHKNKEGAKVLLVTNSQFTSVVEEYLEDLKRSDIIEIDLIDGLLLKKLIAKRSRLLNKYFLK